MSVTSFTLSKKIATDVYSVSFQDASEKRKRSTTKYDLICTSGVATDKQAIDIAQSWIRDRDPRDAFGNPISDIKIATTVADGVAWEIDAEYASNAETPDVFFDYCYIDRLTGASETSTVTKSLRQIPHRAAGPFGREISQNGYINVVDGVAQGVPVLTPTGKFSVRARIAYTKEKLLYARDLLGYQGKTNLYQFWSYPPGTVLFEGFDFVVSGVSDSGDFSNAFLDGRFNFHVRPDEPVNIDGAQFVKGGWEAVWALSCETDDEESGLRIRSTVCVYQETVYNRFDFGVLCLTNILNNID